MSTKRYFITGWRLGILALLASALSLGFNGNGCNLTDNSNSGSSTILIIKANSLSIIRDHDSNPNSEINVPAEAVDRDTEVAFIPFRLAANLPKPLPDGCEFLGGANLTPRHNDKINFHSGKETDCYVVLPYGIRTEELSNTDIRLMEFIDNQWVIVLPDKKGKVHTEGLNAGYIGPDESAPAKLTGIRPFCWAIIKDPAIILSLYNLWLTISTTSTTGGAILTISIPPVLNTSTTQPIIAQPPAVIVPPATTIWTSRSPMPTTMSGFCVAVEVNGKIYFIGGTSGKSYLNVNVEYDPVTNKWTTKAPMPTPRNSFAVGVVNNKIYAIGGSNSSSYVLTANEEYDPIENIWVTKADMPKGRHALSVGVVNNKIYAIGGYDGSVYSFTTNEEYDPAKDTWATKAPIPTTIHAFTIAVVNNKIYAIGGYNIMVGVNLNLNQEYDPGTNRWTTKAPMPTARHFLTCRVINNPSDGTNKIYVMGGSRYQPYTTPTYLEYAANEEYEPASDTWTHKQNMPNAGYFTICVVGNKIYALDADNQIWQYDPSLDR
ncbi:MAG: hypothetical protein V1871_04735 [Planctomycetota bacterium]